MRDEMRKEEIESKKQEAEINKLLYRRKKLTREEKID